MTIRFDAGQKRNGFFAGGCIALLRYLSFQKNYDPILAFTKGSRLYCLDLPTFPAKLVQAIFEILPVDFGLREFRMREVFYFVLVLQINLLTE